MTSRYRRSMGRTGRSRGGLRFVKLDHWMLKTAAWRSLDPAARAVYVELAQRYNGSNNGEISLSVREAALLVHVAKDTASKTLHELEEKGFIKRSQCGSFNFKLRHATTWILTEFELYDTPPTKEFARWSAKNSEAGPKAVTDCPNPRTSIAKFCRTKLQAVLDLGPWARSCTAARSQMTAHI